MLQVITFSFILVVLTIVLQILTRSFRHPLSRFPGPLLAKWTVYYRAYYDIHKRGGWLRHLEVLHSVYGPVVRVGPNELHFSNPHAYGEIYAPGSPFHKDPALYSAFGASSSVFTTHNPQDAAVIRNILTLFFTRRSVIRREAAIREKIFELISRLKSFNHESGLAANLDNALPSLSLDVFSSLTFSKSFNMLSAPALDHIFVRRGPSSSLNLWMMKYLPSRNAPILGAFSLFLLRMSPVAEAVGVQFQLIKKEIDIALNGIHLDEVRNRVANTSEFNASVETESDETDVPFYSFLLKKIQEPSRKATNSMDTMNRLKLLNIRRLLDEGINLRFAGTDTVANAWLVGVRYLLAHKEVLGRLVAELDEAWPDSGEISYENLEKLPYLTAVVKESLRLSHGVVSPMGRVVGPGNAEIMNEIIPAGTIVSISATFVHLNTELFPEPTKFSPERWLKSIDEKKEASTEVNSDKYLVSFSRGPRSCPGIHLARCELYMLFGFLFRNLELTPTAEQDPNSSLYFDDLFTPLYTGDPLCVFTKERRNMKI